MLGLRSKLCKGRYALVIGNAEYEGSLKLKSSANDAKEVAAKLESIGFEVTTLIDQKRRDLELSYLDFRDPITDAEAVVIYFSGHGIQSNGENYLVPADVRPQAKDWHKRIKPFALRRMIGELEGKAKSRILILDACRTGDLPMKLAEISEDQSAASEGLSEFDAGPGSFVAYAAAPGQPSWEGNQDLSYFTQHFTRHMPGVGIDIDELFTRVRNDVIEHTKSNQLPWSSSALNCSFYFNPVDWSLIFSRGVVPFSIASAVFLLFIYFFAQTTGDAIGTSLQSFEYSKCNSKYNNGECKEYVQKPLIESPKFSSVKRYEPWPTWFLILASSIIFACAYSWSLSRWTPRSLFKSDRWKILPFATVLLAPAAALVVSGWVSFTAIDRMALHRIYNTEFHFIDKTLNSKEVTQDLEKHVAHTDEVALKAAVKNVRNYFKDIYPTYWHNSFGAHLAGHMVWLATASILLILFTSVAHPDVFQARTFAILLGASIAVPVMIEVPIFFGISALEIKVPLQTCTGLTSSWFSSIRPFKLENCAVEVYWMGMIATVLLWQIVAATAIAAMIASTPPRYTRFVEDPSGNEN